MVNIIFCLAIVGIAFWIGLKEQKFISDYQKEDYVIVKESIDNLQQYKINNKNIIQSQKKETEIIKWLTQHLKGELHSSGFKPEQDKNGDFILFSYPSFLGKPVPRSPVNFAPALLTAIGILGTLLAFS
ncbi:hypothetical protein NIES4102_21350 [Chondrocystis sp. NIES-4102]|nr:hypothetical protein NIES4102_21350 [Chondrocystis sp. NIES-4102]